MMMKQRLFKRTPMLLLLILSTVITRAQEVALKTNLLGLATTSLNAGLEIGTGRKSTFQLFGALNPWKFSGDKKLRYWNVTLVHLPEIWRPLFRHPCPWRWIQRKKCGPAFRHLAKDRERKTLRRLVCRWWSHLRIPMAAVWAPQSRRIHRIRIHLQPIQALRKMWQMP